MGIFKKERQNSEKDTLSEIKMLSQKHRIITFTILRNRCWEDSLMGIMISRPHESLEMHLQLKKASFLHVCIDQSYKRKPRDIFTCSPEHLCNNILLLLYGIFFLQKIAHRKVEAKTSLDPARLNQCWNSYLVPCKGHFNATV